MTNKDHLTDTQISAINNGKTPDCPECEDQMILRRSRFGLFYGCRNWPDCQSTHGAHPDGKPLGYPATPEVKKLRIRAHELLDSKFGRENYFKFLCKMLGIPRSEAHIAMLRKQQLEVVITTLEGDWDRIK